MENAEKKFWKEVFLAALPPAIAVENWTRRDEPIRGLDQRVELAADFADVALTEARKRGAV